MKLISSSIAAVAVTAGLVLTGGALTASANSLDIGSKICWDATAASTAYNSATSAHFHQANGVGWSSRTFGPGLHRYADGTGVVTMQISYLPGTETGHAFSCANGSF